MCDLAPILNSGLVTGLVGLGGVVIGRWLESKDAEKRARRDGLIEVNKIILVWQDLALAKMLFDFGVSDEAYLRSVSDKAFEAQALLEVVGASELVFAFGDLRSAVIALSSKTLELKKSGKVDFKRGIEQFSAEPETKQYWKAKRIWIDALRKQSGAGPVVVPVENANV